MTSFNTSLSVEVDVSSATLPSKVIMLLNSNVTVHSCTVALNATRLNTELRLHPPVYTEGSATASPASWPLVTGVVPVTDEATAETYLAFDDASADFSHGLTAVELVVDAKLEDHSM